MEWGNEMKLENQFEEQYDEQNRKGNSLLMISVVIISLAFILVIGIVILSNRETIFGSRETVLAGEVSQTEDTVDISGLVSGSNLVSDDLDIWEEYMIEEEEDTENPYPNMEKEEEDLSDGGTKTLIERKDGSSEWVNISEYLPQNEYDNSGFAMLNNRMLYYEDGIKHSYAGVDISKYQGYVDFNEVKRDGIDYVMIRLGQRGYSTGQLVLDDYYSDNMKRATDADLDIGVTFFSQAVNVEEAEEEAEFVLEYLKDWEIQYPVVFSMEHIENDSARIDILTKEDKTQITKAFLAKIEEAGYIGMISGDKEWMFEDINYAAVSNYGVWLNQMKDLPDYPYRYQMWKYTNVGTVEGISGPVSLSVSFVDYSVK